MSEVKDGPASKQFKPGTEKIFVRGKLPGTNNVTFSLSKPTAGWPEGAYRVDLFIDGKAAGNLPFKVAK